MNPRLPGEKIFIGAASSSHSLSSTSPARRAARTPRRATMAATIVSSVSLTARPRAATRELRARAAPAKATRVVALRASSEKARPPRRRLHQLHITSASPFASRRVSVPERRPRFDATLRPDVSRLTSTPPYPISNPIRGRSKRRPPGARSRSRRSRRSPRRPRSAPPRCVRDNATRRSVARSRASNPNPNPNNQP